MSARPRIVLLRAAPSEPDPYVAAFEAAGFEAVCLPVLEVEMVEEGVSAIGERLARPEAYGGLVLTSRNAVPALDAHRERLAPWRAKPTYAVGPATAEAARALGLRAVGEEAGYGSVLAARIVADASSRPLLFLAAADRRPDLPQALAAAGVPFEEVTVYRKVARPVRLAGAPNWVAFFSPSGVAVAESSPGFPWAQARLAAIGWTTAEALREAGHPPAAVAAEPTPQSLVAAVLGLEDRG